jgi:hypothetical protein
MTYETLVLELNKTAAAMQTAKLSTASYELYWEHFGGEADEDFARACFLAREACDYFPTIRQLRAFLPDRRARVSLQTTGAQIARQRLAAMKAYDSWPRRLGRQDPTPACELVGVWMGPAPTAH